MTATSTNPQEAQVPREAQVEPETAPIGCANSADCNACAVELGQWMHGLIVEGDVELLPLQIPPPFRPVVLPPGQASENLTPSDVPVSRGSMESPVIVITTDVVIFEGASWAARSELYGRQPGEWKLPPIAQADTQHWQSDDSERSEIAQAVADHWRSRAASEERFGTEEAAPRELIIEADAQVPWRVVQRVAGAAAATGIEAITFAFLKPSAVPRPGPSKMDADIRARVEELRAFDKSGRAAILAEPRRDYAAEVYGHCPSALEAVGNAADMGRQEKAEYFPAALSEAIRGCDCRIDIESLKALHWWGSGRLTNNDHVYVGVRVPLTSEGNKKRAAIKVGNDVPWSVAHKKVLAAVAAGRDAYYFTYPGDRQAMALSRPHRAKELLPSATALHGEEQQIEGVLGGFDVGGLDVEGLDDGDVYRRLLGNDVGEFAGGWGTDSKTPTPQVQLGHVSAAGGLDKNVIRRFVRRKLPRILRCYKKVLLATPELSGTIVTQFEIEPGGHPQEVLTEGLDSPDLRSCVVSGIRAIQFPKPKRGAVRVRYPFRFIPGSR